MGIKENLIGTEDITEGKLESCKHVACREKRSKIFPLVVLYSWIILTPSGGSDLLSQ